MTRKLHLVGNFPLILFVQSNCLLVPRALQLDLIYSNDVLTITCHGQQPNMGFELCEYKLNLNELERIVLESRNAHVVFQQATLASDAHIHMIGPHNTVEFWECFAENLVIDSSAENTLKFDRQPLLNSVDASLSHTLLTGLKVRGRSSNVIAARQHSAVELSVGLAKDNSRMFSFSKDDSSMIAVTCSARGAREVVEDSELWSISDTLESIVPTGSNASRYLMDWTETATPSTDTTPNCAVCLSARPEMLVQPCNHLCLCQSCARNLCERNIEACPMCRGSVGALTQVWISCS